MSESGNKYQKKYSLSAFEVTISGPKIEQRHINSGKIPLEFTIKGQQGNKGGGENE